MCIQESLTGTNFNWIQESFDVLNIPSQFRLKRLLRVKQSIGKCLFICQMQHYNFFYSEVLEQFRHSG